VADIDGYGHETARLFGDGFDAAAVRVDKDGNEGWYLADRQGNVRLISDGSDIPLAERSYGAYGNIVSETGTPDRYGYTGREHDALTGLTHYRARERAGGAWLTPDPIGFAAGDAYLYRYVGNDPVNRSDPSGYYIYTRPGEGVPESLSALVARLGIGTETFVIDDPSMWQSQRTAIIAKDPQAVQDLLNDDWLRRTKGQERRFTDYERKILEAMLN
jgi:RHS repeat-associated protein